MHPLRQQSVSAWLREKSNALSKTQGWSQVKRWVEAPGVIPGLLTLICLVVVLMLSSQWQVVVDGNIVGVVRRPQAINAYVAQLEAQMHDEYGEEVRLASEVQVSRLFFASVMESEEVLSSLESELKWGIEAAVIHVNGQPVIALHTVEEAEAVVEGIKDSLLDRIAQRYNQATIHSVGMPEKLDIAVKAIVPEMVGTVEEAEQVLLYGNRQVYQHVVSRGDTMSRIAASRGIRVSDLQAANPEVNPLRLQIGQTLALHVPEPYINMTVVLENKESQAIPFTTRYVPDDTLWNWQTQVVTPGRAGSRELTVLVTVVNGIEVKREVKQSRVLTEPVQAVVRQGTKKATVLGSGHFIWPTEGVLTSGYGMRWGSFHRGIDIGAPTGTPIRASDAGTVVFSGARGLYGYMVQIDHGNGYTTLYAHCSRLLVSVGQQVKQGEVIALVGSTGNSTGPHLHFEIHHRGNTVNPLNFFR